MNSSLVSVIIPFYSGIRWIFEAVDSVLAQTYNNIEIIVINDGSKEDLSTFLKKYEKDIVYLTQDNMGAAAARNLGIEMSTGEYVAFLDADDIWLPEKLETQIEYMAKNNFFWSHTSYITFGENIRNKTHDLSKYQGNIYPHCIVYNPIATPCVVVRSSILKENKELRFEVGMKSGEDSIFWLRLGSKYCLGVVDKVLTKVRIRGSNSALMAYAQVRARAQIWDKIKEEGLVKKSELTFVVSLTFTLCKLIYRILTPFNNEKNGNKIEVISKLLYFIPWLIFKSQKSNV